MSTEKDKLFWEGSVVSFLKVRKTCFLQLIEDRDRVLLIFRQRGTDKENLSKKHVAEVYNVLTFVTCTTFFIVQQTHENDPNDQNVPLRIKN